MSVSTPYLEALIPALPSDLQLAVKQIRDRATPGESTTLENLTRFLGGADPLGNSISSPPSDYVTQWKTAQKKSLQLFRDLNSPPESPNGTKRPRDAEDDDDSAETSKRRRLPSPSTLATPNGASDHPLYTLHSISATSPVRKKVDITITAQAIQLIHPTSSAIEFSLPLSSLKRAFLLPTRGRQKPHWTVVLLTSDSPPEGAPTTGVAANAANPQITFGIDAVLTAPISVSKYARGNDESISQPSASEVTRSTVPKGEEIISSLRAFLAFLPIPLFEPSTEYFKSACQGSGHKGEGVPGVEAYLGVKTGTLWFMDEGVLWSENRPCLFWPAEEMEWDSGNGFEGVRVINVGGRTCNVVVTRKGKEKDGNEDEGEQQQEVEFSLVDSKEQAGIVQWVKGERDRFSKGKGKAVDKGKGKEKTMKSANLGSVGFSRMEFGVEDDGEEDEDFATSSDGSQSLSSSEESSGDEAEGEEGSDGDEEAEVSGEDGESQGSEEDGEGELDPAQHPLMRPGAVPKMSRAAMDMVVDMVQQDLMGSPAEEEEEDELDE